MKRNLAVNRREFQRRLTEQFENLPLLAYFISPTGKIVDCNKMAVKTLGYADKKELIGKPLLTTVYAPSSREKARKLFLKWKKTKRVRNEELQIITKQGQVIDVLLNADAIYDRKGKLLHSISTQLDITERKEMEARNKYLASFPELNPNPVIEVDPAGRITYRNSAVVETLKTMGLQDNPSTFLPKDMNQILDDLKQKKKKKSEFYRQVEIGDSVFGETFHFTPDYKAVRIYATDITERKRMEETLRLSESKYGALVDNASDRVFLIGGKDEILSINPAAARALGRTVEQVTGKTLFDVYPKEIAAMFSKNVKEVLQTGKSKSIDEKVVFAGKEFWINTRLEPLLDDKGKAHAVTGIARDITERKQMEEELRSARDRLQFLVSSNPAVLYTSKTSGDFGATFISDNVASQLGYETRDFTEDPKFWANKIHPEDAPRIFAELSHLFEKNYHVHEYRILHKDGTYRWMHDEMRLIRDAAGHPKEIIGYWNDITERKQMEEKLTQYSEHLEALVKERTRNLSESEQRFRSLFDGVGDGVLVVDVETKKFYLGNKAMCQMLGYRLEEIKNLGVMDIHPKESVPLVMEQFDRQSRGEIEVITDIPVKRSDGSVFYVDITPSSLIFNGRMCQLGVFRDITERKRMEMMRNDFVEEITDELMTPLVSMKGYLDLMISKSQEMPGDFHKNLEVVKRNTDRLVNLTSQLVDLRRLGAGRFPLDLKSMNLQETIRECVNGIQPLISEKKQTLRVDIPERPLMIQGDSVGLSQVLMALLSNAVKFTPEGGDITLHAKEIETDVQVQVSDTGIGLKREDIESVFEPFAAIQKTEYVKGAGLGLSLTKALIEAHAGKIWAESPGEGEGATFTFTLPKRKEAD